MRIRPNSESNQDLITDSRQPLQRREHLPILSLKELDLSSVIGGGAFGQVWRGSWRSTPVAVKILSSACQSAIPDQVLKAFEDEVYMLAGLRHPNICLFMGRKKMLFLDAFHPKKCI